MTPASTLSVTELDAHRVGLRGHCYRMLGAAQDAEDAVQETLIRAWQKADQYQGSSVPELKGWLYRIATRVCLDQIESRTRRALPWNLGPASSIDQAKLEARPASEWLEPMPDAMVVPDDANPAERVVLRQSIRLAFLAALQHLPGRQRAALLLIEVLGWSAVDAAECIECSVPALNSALQRARATLAERDLSAAHRPPSTVDEEQLVARYVDAFERYDMDGLAALIRADAQMQMPPYDLWLQGFDDIKSWMIGPGIACAGSRLVRVAAAGSLAFGQYKPDPDGDGFVPWSLIVLEVDGDRIAGIHHFLDTAGVFPRFGLPPRL